MRFIRFLLAGLTLAALGALPVAAQQARPSPPATITAKIDGADLKLDYGRPSMRGRKIWGELVPFAKVWRTGANEATTLTLSKAITIGGKDLPAGKYTLWTQPEADGSAQLIINKQTGQWGTDYDGSQDLFRVDLKREALSEPVEQFVMSIEPATGGGVLKMAWEKTQYSVAFTVKK
jgi:hypothetical protein